MAGLPLVGLADVDDGDLAALLKELDFGRRHFPDVGSGLPEEVGIGLRHVSWVSMIDGLPWVGRAE
jgi:hypothetical protein